MNHLFILENVIPATMDLNKALTIRDTIVNKENELTIAAGIVKIKSVRNPITMPKYNPLLIQAPSNKLLLFPQSQEKIIPKINGYRKTTKVNIDEPETALIMLGL